MNDTLLNINDLVVDYGIVRAIKTIDMRVGEKDIVAILGANGAGKTTTIRTINGMVKPAAGTISFAGDDITGETPYKLASKGIIQAPEGRMILNGLTVEENLMVGAYSLKGGLIRIRDDNGDMREVRMGTRELKQKTLEEVYGYFPVLKDRKKQQAATLSGGEQQMLAIGRALMGRPKLLLLDEPSLGLAPLIVRDIFEIIQQINQDGTTILIVEQNALQTLKIADYVYVMELGKIKAEGNADEFLENDELIEAYLGKKE
jgi:branched-chain amino acid transport system ATP-binding protein